MRCDVNKNGAMDLIAVCPKLIPVSSEGTLFRGFITVEVVDCCSLYVIIL